LSRPTCANSPTNCDPVYRGHQAFIQSDVQAYRTAWLFRLHENARCLVHLRIACDVVEATWVRDGVTLGCRDLQMMAKRVLGVDRGFLLRTAGRRAAGQIREESAEARGGTFEDGGIDDGGHLASPMWNMHLQ
jgi:hypothetical protein